MSVENVHDQSIHVSVNAAALLSSYTALWLHSPTAAGTLGTNLVLADAHERCGRP